MKKKSLSQVNLDVAVGLARDLADHEEDKRRAEFESGKRNEREDLPTGHPMKVVMDDAQRRFEDHQVNEEKTKTIKRTQKIGKSDGSSEREEAKRRKAIRSYNDEAGKMLSGMQSFLNISEGMFGEMNGIPTARAKLMRVKRALSAACYAVGESLLRDDQS